ncbi:hypothetical protein DE146DRAFT_750431 [Phaeosphaeria sp. MPI-PUGE-AT-0046c]|nr:hypothetical protein DE146DRAFT_750431 [Phaeosphaeria sp. MPI-PUGE-AT-0046c]
MSHFGRPFIPVNTPSQLLQPGYTIQESVSTVSTHSTRVPWTGGPPSGKQQQTHGLYMKPTGFDSRVFSGDCGLNPHNFLVPNTPGTLRQTSFPGRESGFTMACPSGNRIQRRGHYTMADPIASAVDEPNQWLPFNLMPSHARRSDGSFQPVHRIVHPIVADQDVLATPYLMPNVSHNMCTDQDATLSQLPWSSDNTRAGRGDTISYCDPDRTELHEIVSDTSRSRDGSAMFCNDDHDPTTSTSSYNNDVNAAAGIYEHGRSVRSVDLGDIDAMPDEAHPFRSAFDLRHRQDDRSYCSGFRLNVREGTPQATEHNGDVLSAGLLQRPDTSQHLSPHLVPIDSSSDGESPSSNGSSTMSDVWHCPNADCGQTFTGRYARGNLNRHRRQYHQSEGMTELICEVPSCARVFRRQDSRLKHYRRRHPDLGARAAIPRGSRQHNTSGMSSTVREEVPQEAQESVLRSVSSWTDRALGPYYFNEGRTL